MVTIANAQVATIGAQPVMHPAYGRGGDLTAPFESPQKNLMEVGEVGLAADQEAPPKQRAHVPKHHPELIMFFHLSNLPGITGTCAAFTPGFFRSSAHLPPFWIPDYPKASPGCCSEAPLRTGPDSHSEGKGACATLN
jgi:hypothetical protein